MRRTGIKRRKKICKTCEETKYIWAHGNCKYCDSVLKSNQKKVNESNKKAEGVTDEHKEKINQSIGEYANILGMARKYPQGIRAYLQKQLDNKYHRYIRVRDADNNGRCDCSTCGKSVKWQGSNECDAGHFVSRALFSTRWDEMNCHAQCKYCNHQGSGMPYEMAQYIDLKYGEGTAEKLKLKSKTEAGPNNIEMIDLIIYFNKEYFRIKKEKSL